jgi:hypothetical protein
VALVKKGSRFITVDGVVYRWRLRGRPTYSQGITEQPLAFAVEQADRKGSVLLVTMPQDHPSNWMGGPVVPVLPSTVAAIVRRAVTLGWQSAVPGPAFRLNVFDRTGRA